MRKRIAVLFAMLAVCASLAHGQTTIPSESYDGNRTVANLNETILNTSNVNATQFGKLFSLPVDGAIYAQPLYIPNVSIHGSSHNVVYVATMDDVAYAFDADVNTVPLWMVDFKNPPAVTAVISQDGNITDNIGIESTPVIDVSSGTLFLVTYTHENTNDVYRLHALDITSGTEKFGGPVVISATGGPAFDPAQEMQRPGLAFVNGQVFVAFGSFGDTGTYHGWIMAYAEQQGLPQTSVLCITPTGSEGAIWMSGRAPVVDSSGNLYYITANGTYDGTSNFGESFAKYATSGALSLLDWFTPADFATLNSNDEDLGASGPLLIPGTNLILGGGKDGLLYVVNTANMGHEWAGDSQIVQSFNVGGSIYPGPAFYNHTDGLGPSLYIWPQSGYLAAYHFNGTTFDTPPVSKSLIQAQTTSYAAALAVSANGSTPGTGIVWASMPSAPNGYDGGAISAVLRAFDANDLTHELWDSQMDASRDNAGLWSKFRSPVVANGRVYVGSVTNNNQVIGASLSVYGLISGGSSGPSATATFLTTDSTTKGNWQSLYGVDGHSIPGVSQTIPTYATFSVPNSNPYYTWATNTSDPRALASSATCWWNPSGFSIDLTVSGTHQISLYAVDWDNLGRVETITVTDAGTGTILDTRSLSNFSGGVYLLWNISGNVVITVTPTSGPNSVISGIFFDPVSGTGTRSATGSWSWPALTGTASYNVYKGSSSSGPWTLLTSTTSTSFADSTLVSGQTEYYKVTAVIAGVESAYVTFSITVP